MKLFNSYPLTTITEMNLQSVLVMWELLIHAIMKENEARTINNFEIYHLIGRLQITYRLY